MRRVSVALMLALGLAAPAFADTLDVLKANTLVLTERDGGAITVLVSDAGRMNQVNARGMEATGIWSMTERGFCWTARGEAQVCIPLAEDKAAGDSWEIAGPTGQVIWIAEIREGRADLSALAVAMKAAAAGLE